MAVKTITIDLEAYDTLARYKQPGQSFSQVIKAHFGPRKTVGAFREALRDARLSSRTVKAIEDQVSGRPRSQARVPQL
jgi:predicted CopG family antitoxin